MPDLPRSAEFVIIGAGIHGLSTACTSQGLARGETVGEPTHRRARQDRHRRRRVGHRLRRRAQQLLPARDARADGALGRSLGAATPTAYSYHPRRLHADQPRGHARAGRRRSTSSSRRSATSPTFIEGEAAVERYMRGLFSDWQARRTSPRCCTRSAAATPTTWPSVRGLADKAQALGVRDLRRRRRHGLRRQTDARSTAVRHRPRHDRLRPGRRRASALDQLDLGHARAAQDDRRQGPRRRSPRQSVRMWRYMALQEGTLGVDPDLLRRPTRATCRR